MDTSFWTTFVYEHLLHDLKGVKSFAFLFVPLQLVFHNSSQLAFCHHFVIVVDSFNENL